MCHSFHTDVHFLASGVVEELHFGFALFVGLDVGLPPDGASEVCHRGNDAVVFRLEGGGLVETFKVGAAKSLVALGAVLDMRVDIYQGFRA